MLLLGFFTPNIPSTDIFSLTHITNFSSADLISQTMIFAQDAGKLSQVDIIKDITNAWENFIETGQVWALLIGMFLGYAFRSFLP
jgi:hypothetical protein